ncbi:MAG TPA: DUF1697 domain-containing protein [Vicinamibacterales bacterium]|nr:DUF1697 domain-containing protein [Vicinamibacterales bacterium]
MTRYVAFLRAINVRGHPLIAMPELCAAFQSAGCRNATTFIQSGDVILDTAMTDPVFVEQAFGVPATSRNWNTVKKLLDRATR